MTKSIIVRYQAPGKHRWPDAPNPVGFLQFMHRHMFHIEAQISVTDNNRELEFFMVQDELADIVRDFFDCQQSSFSCEDMCEYIVEKLQRRYGEDRWYTVRVFEDGENGSEVSTRWQ
jgi:hypothetical protein